MPNPSTARIPPALHIQLDDGTTVLLSPEQVAQIKVDEPPRLIQIREARQFADLYSVWADLDMAVTALDRLIAIRDSPTRDKDGVLEHSYWITAIVHYARCFTEGKRRTGLSRSIVGANVSEPLMLLHNWILAMRNKHVAHDENAYQQFIGSVVIRRSPDGRTLVSPNVSATGVIAVDADRARAMRELMVAVGEIVKKRMTTARQRFVEAVAAMPLSEVEALPPIEFIKPTIDDASKSRGETKTATEQSR